MTSIIGAYDDRALADKAVAALRKEGFENGDIQILKGDRKKLMATLAEHGFDEEDARAYVDAAGDGKVLLVASVSEDQAENAERIMGSFEAGEESGERSAGPVPVVEEELSVGKSRVANGGARVTSSTTETPVEEAVTLQDETVKVERKEADRVLDEEEADEAFREKTVEMMGATEEAEVRKEARVVGEVELRKETRARQKTVSDTVRKTDVKVEEVGSGTRKK